MPRESTQNSPPKRPPIVTVMSCSPRNSGWPWATWRLQRRRMLPPNADSVLAGWLQLGPVALELQRDPMHAATALENWRRLFPQHPANEGVLALARSQIAVATEFPDQIALLLPLSGRAESVGV